MNSRLKKGGIAAALAISLIGAWEGLRLYSYQDVIGVWTACYGETLGIKPGMRFTKAECDAMFLPSIQKHEAGMRACLKDPDAIPEKPYVVFVSLTYNIGTAGFCRSSLRVMIDQGRYRDACNALPAFNRAGGKVVQGLVNRRAAEQKLCLEGLR